MVSGYALDFFKPGLQQYRERLFAVLSYRQAAALLRTIRGKSADDHPAIFSNMVLGHR